MKEKNLTPSAINIPWYHKIFTKTILFLILPSILPLMLAMAAGVFYVGLDAKKEAEKNLIFSVSEATMKIEQYFHQMEEGIRFIASHFSHHVDDYATKDNFLLVNAFATTHEDIQTVWATDTFGKTILLYSRQDMLDSGFTDNQLRLQEPKADGAVTWFGSTYNEFGEPILTCTVPIKHPWESTPSGFLTFEVRSEFLKKISFSLVTEIEGISFLVDKGGKIISHSQKGIVSSKYDITAHPALQAPSPFDSKKRAPELIRGQDLLIAYQFINPIGGRLVIQKKVSEIYKTRSRLIGFVLAAFFLLFLVTIPLNISFSLRITRPISDLLAAFNSFTHGKLNGGTTGSDSSELGLLAKSFHLMAEERLASEQRYRELVDMTDNLITQVDENGRFIFVNHVGQKVFGTGTDKLIGLSAFDFIHPEDQERTAKWFADCTEKQLDKSTIENRQVSMNKELVTYFLWNSHFFYNTDGKCIRVDGIAHNITDRKHAEIEKEKVAERLLQSQKMESIGTLAGGIAHDFNNILTPILGYTELALGMLPPSDSLADTLKEVEKAANRAKHLVKQILMFSRKDEHSRSPLAPHIVIKESMKLLRASIPTTIEFRENIPSDCGMILGDPTQLQQIIMNLCTNAYHAMRETGGVLGVSLKRIEVPPEDSKVLSELMTAGSYIDMEVSDTGCGMNTQTKEKIFEPYFTTKAKGEGTGLGLATVHGIAKSYGGHISVYSELGQGTTIHVYLPLEDVIEQNERVEIERGPIPHGNERLLLVDDEKTITSMQQDMLTRLGYTVTACNESEKAFKIFEEETETIDLIVTDMTMPHLTGLELSEKVLRIRPDMPIVLCTGFSELINKEKATEIGIREFLMKPVSIQDLACSIRRALEKYI